MMESIQSKFKRVGHVAASVLGDDLVLLWGGYMESSEQGPDIDSMSKYYDPSEVLLYCPVTGCCTTKITTGAVPPVNSGSCGVVCGEGKDNLYIYGGYFADPDVEGTSNNLYNLNLNTWIWTRCEPSGFKPLHRDKLMGWEFQNKVYFFSGFGTPPIDDGQYAGRYEYISDRSHQWYAGRGWNNQLVAYNRDFNEWEWPETKGQTPSPRAALAGFRWESRVYIFGGRLKETRLNDLYYLDLNTMTWSENLNSGKLSPRGRSWHSFTILGESPKALLYGGLSSEGDVLGDAWIYHLEENVWTELILKNCDKRLWHQSSYIDNQIIVFGGVNSNIHSQVATVHPEGLLLLNVNPKSLLRLSLECCSYHFDSNYPAVGCLPKHLRKLLEARRNAAS